MIHKSVDQHKRAQMLGLIAKKNAPIDALQYILFPLSIAVKLIINEKGEANKKPKVHHIYTLIRNYVELGTFSVLTITACFF